MKKLLCWLFYVLFAFNYCYAQSSLKGSIKDNNGRLLPYTTITLVRQHASAPVITQADSLAHFSFTGLSDGQYTLSAYALGYSKHTFTLDIQKDTFVNIILHPLQSNLKGVTVIESKPVIEQKTDRIIFNVAQSISAAGSNGLDVLKKAPGIIVNEDNVSLAGRGEMAVMVNGQMVHLAGKALTNYLKSFSSSQISKIEIITHPSAKYDAEGNAGLINIITKKSSRMGLSGNIDGSLKRFFYKNQPDYKGIRNYGDIDGSAGLYYNRNKWTVYSNLSYSAGRELWGYGIDVNYPDKNWAMKDTGEYRISTLNVLAGTDYQLNKKTTVGFEYNYIRHIEDGADYVRVPVYNPKGQLDSTLKTYATYYPVAVSNAFNFHLIQALNESGAKLTLNADYFNFYRYDRSHLITQSYNGEGKPVEGSTSRLYDTTLQNIRIYTFKGDVDIPTPFAQFSVGSKL
ncbi:MAG: carboxypeptidase regulatory-like domain-containing protein, partial [Chitinophagaceae bacterium]